MLLLLMIRGCWYVRLAVTPLHPAEGQTGKCAPRILPGAPWLKGGFFSWSWLLPSGPLWAMEMKELELFL